jgi:hypothetical protein
MHVDGAAVRWLQSVEHRLKNARWGQFCAMVHERLGVVSTKPSLDNCFTFVSPSQLLNMSTNFHL